MGIAKAKPLSSQTLLDWYESVRARLPMPVVAQAQAQAQAVSGLLSLADQYDTFVFDAFGVLNAGSQPIPGAIDCLHALMRGGKSVYVLSNGASLTKPHWLQRLQHMGFQLGVDQLVSSRDSVLNALAGSESGVRYGVILPEGSATEDLPDHLVWPHESGFLDADRFLFLSSDGWTPKSNRVLIDTLRRRPRPVILGNPDLVAPRDQGLSLQPGFYSLLNWPEALHGLIDAHGKPFQSVFDLLKQRMRASGDNPDTGRTLMVGDTLHTDILGGQVAGFDTALVTGHGAHRGLDIDHCIARSGIVPTWHMYSIGLSAPS